MRNAITEEEIGQDNVYTYAARVSGEIGVPIQWQTPEEIAVRDSAGNVISTPSGRYTYNPDTGIGTVVLKTGITKEEAQNFLIKHELTHAIEGTSAWNSIAKYAQREIGTVAFEEAKQAKIREYAANNETLTDRGAQREVVAQWVGQNLFQNGFAQAIVSGNASVGNAFVRTLDKLRLALGGTKNSRTASNIALVERLFMRALQNAPSQNNAGDFGVYSENSIETLPDGRKYVKADRQVIYGDDPKQWAKQVKNYIDDTIRDGKDVVVYAADGDALTITEDTSGKARFRNDVRLKDGTTRPMTDEEYAVKLRAETHIDELAAVSTRGKHTVPDTKDHSFAKDGFNYRTAFFLDNDGQYYRLTISVGNKGLVKTIYNVGKIKEADYPLSGSKAVSKNDTMGSASNTIKAQNSFGVNNYSMQSGGENSQFSFVDANEGDLTTPPPSDAANSQALGNLDESADRSPISMEEFANTDAPIWRNVAYEDDETKARIMQETHQSMVESGSVVVVSDSVLEDMERAFPDLREMKKRDRTPILKAALNKVKADIRQFLNGFKNQGFEFEVNGRVLDAKLYSTGINEVLEKITQQKAGMLYSSEEIFRNARYLYSTPDYDGDPNIYRWNYFYTPLQIGETTVGVRIAVRDMAAPAESQIYNWGIKKDTSLDGVGRGANDRIPHGASSDVSNPILPDSQPKVKENSSPRMIAQGRTLEELASELGDEELSRRMYMAMRAQSLPSTVEVDGQSVDTSSYIDAVERDLPNDQEGLREFIRDAERQLAAAAGQAYISGEPESIAGLPINLQLFAARRRLDMMLDEGETGNTERRFYWQRTRGLDANKSHEAELIEYLAGRSETYNPISNQKTLDAAKEYLRNPERATKLERRVLRFNPNDRFNEIEEAAVMVMINDARNDGDFDRFRDLTAALSRKGTDAGRAVQILAMQARMTPEGTLRAVERIYREATEAEYGSGFNEGIDLVGEKLVDVIERAQTTKENAAPSQDTGNAPDFDNATLPEVEQALGDKIVEAGNPYITEPQIREMIRRVVDDTTNIPRQQHRRRNQNLAESQRSDRGRVCWDQQLEKDAENLISKKAGAGVVSAPAFFV